MITLLGPQHAQPKVARALRELGAKRVAVITTGWQERESDPGVLPELGVPSVNLGLHARADDVFAKDRELAGAYKARQTRLKLMQEFYRVRLDRLDQAAHGISQRHVDPELLAEERAASIALVRELDREHLARCRAVHDEFDARYPDRGGIVAHRIELSRQLADCDAVVVAGGHVAVLLNRLRMFDLATLWGARPVIAWSAGAMVLCEQVVLFHDDPPSGPRIAELLDAGLGLVRGVIVLPNPRVRLDTGDRDHVGWFARRFAGNACVAMDHRARIEVVDGKAVGGTGNQRLAEDGELDRSWPA